MHTPTVFIHLKFNCHLIMVAYTYSTVYVFICNYSKLPFDYSWIHLQYLFIWNLIMFECTLYIFICNIPENNEWTNKLIQKDQPLGRNHTSTGTKPFLKTKPWNNFETILGKCLAMLLGLWYTINLFIRKCPEIILKPF